MAGRSKYQGGLQLSPPVTSPVPYPSLVYDFCTLKHNCTRCLLPVYTLGSGPLASAPPPPHPPSCTFVASTSLLPMCYMVWPVLCAFSLFKSSCGFYLIMTSSSLCPAICVYYPQDLQTALQSHPYCYALCANCGAN